MFEDEIKIKIEIQLAESQHVALDTDCWTSRSQKGYINVNVHFIDKDWVPHIITLYTEEFEEHHTAENLTDSLHKVISQY